MMNKFLKTRNNNNSNDYCLSVGRVLFNDEGKRIGLKIHEENKIIPLDEITEDK